MTPYSEVFNLFMSKIDDFELKEWYQSDPLYFQELLLDFLKSAIPKFTYCVQDLSQRNDILLQFDISLSDLETEILAILMLAEYYNPKINRDEYLLNYLGGKDYKQWSPSNQLKELRNTKKSYTDEANLLMLEYYYRQGL